MLCALTGTGAPNLVPVVSASNLYNIAGTTAVDEDAGMYQQLITGAGNTTIQPLTVGQAGQLLVLEIANDAGLARTVTLGSNIRGTATTLVGTASRSMMLGLMSNGVKWMEIFRTTAIV
jgi:hypothetical protein